MYLLTHLTRGLIRRWKKMLCLQWSHWKVSRKEGGVPGTRLPCSRKKWKTTTMQAFESRCHMMRVRYIIWIQKTFHLESSFLGLLLDDMPSTRLGRAYDILDPEPNGAPQPRHQESGPRSFGDLDCLDRWFGRQVVWVSLGESTSQGYKACVIT